MRAIIDANADVFTFINTFHTSSDRQAAIIASLKRFTEEVTIHLAGFVAVAIHASEDGQRVVNYVQWRSATDMTAMRSSPSFGHAHGGSDGAGR